MLTSVTCIKEPFKYYDTSGGEWGLLKPSECRHMGEGGLKLFKNRHMILERSVP